MRNSIVVLAFLLTSSTARAQEPRPALSITISIPDSTVTAGSTVKLDITITNLAKRPILVDRVLGRRGEFFHEFDIHRTSGGPTPETEYYRRFREGKLDVEFYETIGHELAPGESLKDQATVTKLYDLTRPGQYTIQARRRDPESKTYIKSNTITLTVK